MFFNFKKNNLDSESIYSVYPHHYDSSFTKLLHLLTDDNILLTFDERDYLYKNIDNIIKFLEDKKNEKNDIR